MDSNEEIIQKRVVVDHTGQRSEVVSERSQRVAGPSSVSTTTVTVIIVVMLIVSATVIYLFSRNANRGPDLTATTEAPPTAVQQPAPVAQPAPIIIQQAAPVQPAPVIVQQPTQSAIERELTSANEDASMQDIATKKLNLELDLGGVVTTVTDSRAVLTGAVGSEAAKAKAEQLVKGVRGVKSVENRIVVSG